MKIKETLMTNQQDCFWTLSTV